MRKDGHRENEAAMLHDLVSRRPTEFERDGSAFDKWVAAQHHSFPTRLLDVTSNPLVALYNAVEKGEECGIVHVFVVPRELVKQHDSDVISLVANFARLERREQNFLLGREKSRLDDPPLRYDDVMQRWYHFIREEKSAFQGRIDARDLYRVFVAEPAHSIERVRAQAGAFLVSAFHEDMSAKGIGKSMRGGGGRSCGSSKDEYDVRLKVPIYDQFKLKVPVCKKSGIRRELDLVGITRGALFPDLDNAAQEVKARY